MCIRDRYLNLKKNNQLNNINTTYYLIRKCYEVNMLGKGKNKLKYSLEEALNLVTLTYKNQ